MVKYLRMNSIACLIVALMFMLLVPRANAKQSADKFVTIPVLYLTDRAMKGDSYTERRRYPVMCQHQMYFGTASVTVPNEDAKQDGAGFKLLGWKGTNQRPAKISAKDKVDPADYAAAKRQFAERLKSALDQAGSDTICIYVHGACDPFEDSLQDAAVMAYKLEKPIVLYSWPSSAKWRSYFIDGVNSEYSQQHFNTFCKDLLAFQSEHPLHVIFISHSMGNRLVIRSLPEVYGKGLVSYWELVSPDTDADTTRHYILGYKPDKAKIHLYVSNKDKMLGLSQLLAGGYYRTGEAASQVSLPPGWQALSSNQIQRIDFTAIDTGFHGHSVPCGLIADMVNKDSPGDNLKLVPESSVKGNRLVRFASRNDGPDDTTGGLPNAYCKRVVKVKNVSQ